MSWIPHLNSLPLVFAGLFCLTLSMAIWRYRHRPTTRTFFYLTLILALWSFGEFGQQGAQTTNGRIFWTTFNLTLIPIVPPLSLLFSLYYTGKQKLIIRSVRLFLFTIATLLICAIWTNELHHLFYRSITIDHFVRGPIFYFHAIYTYILLIITNIFFALFLIRTPKARQQTVIILIGSLVPLAVNLLFITQVFVRQSSIDWTPFVYVVSAGIIMWGLHQGGLLSLSTFAQRIVVDSMPDAMFVLNKDGVLLQMNTQAAVLARYTTYPKLEVGTPALSLLESSSLSPEEISQTYTHELSFGFTENRPTIFEARISPLMDHNGQVNGYVALLRDITIHKLILADAAQKKEMAEQAAQVAHEANRFKTQLISRISHEFRTPLGAVLGISGILDTGALGELNEQQHQMNSRILQNARRLTKLVDELLDQSQLDNTTIQLNIAPITPDPYIKELVAQLESVDQRTDIYIRTELIHDNIQISCDLERLIQVVTNLIGNALKFTTTGGISVWSEIDNGRWYLHIQDTGIGISEEAQEIIFLPFRQADETISRPFDGPGLGLSIAKQLTELMGGTIEVQSQLNIGSTFTIHYPIVPTTSKVLVNSDLSEV